MNLVRRIIVDLCQFILLDLEWFGNRLDRFEAPWVVEVEAASVWPGPPSESGEMIP